jgi:hypothetical protein
MKGAARSLFLYSTYEEEVFQHFRSYTIDGPQKSSNIEEICAAEHAFTTLDALRTYERTQRSEPMREKICHEESSIKTGASKPSGNFFGRPGFQIFRLDEPLVS